MRNKIIKSGVKANYADGVLGITILKAEVKKPKKVGISVSKKENK